MSLYLQVLTEEMAKRGVLFGGDKPLRWLEPGIGDGSSTAKFIKAMSMFHSAGFIIHGSDYQLNSIERARINLTALQGTNIRIGELSVRDAFSGEPLASEKCDCAMLSHFIYHLKSQLDGRRFTALEMDLALRRLIGAVMDSLNGGGVAFAFHEGAASDMFGKLGVEYGSAMNDAPDRIRKAADAIGKPTISMMLESNLYFPDLTQEVLFNLKSIDNWRGHSEGTPEASWIKKFLFALHNTRNESQSGEPVKEGGVRDLDKLPSTRGNPSRMGDAIDRLVELFTRDEYGPHIVIRSEMQVILNDQAYADVVGAAFVEVEKRLPDIRRAARSAMLAARLCKTHLSG
ncbi:hypothetical protein [Rhodoplanes azumiensis]|uniref:Class I SAM-dependent methyltransferase n=1 Tax=Rhodoplanes azumiensis TaxID=1897628 RepID=A0ABW5ALD5_9BRAD